MRAALSAGSLSNRFIAFNGNDGQHTILINQTVHSNLHGSKVCGLIGICKVIYLAVNRIYQNVLATHVHARLRALFRSSAHDTGLDYVCVRTAVGMNIEGALAVRNLSRDDDHRVLGCRCQKTRCEDV
jgi:hypothetical protein